MISMAEFLGGNVLDVRCLVENQKLDTLAKVCISIARWTVLNLGPAWPTDVYAAKNINKYSNSKPVKWYERLIQRFKRSIDYTLVYLFLDLKDVWRDSFSNTCINMAQVQPTL